MWVFRTSVRWSSFIGVWVTASLQDSSQYSGRPQQWYSLDDLCSSSDFYFFQSPYQSFEYCCKGITLIARSIAFLVLWQSLSTYFFFRRFYFQSEVCRHGKVHYSTGSLFINYQKIWSSSQTWVIYLYLKIPVNFKCLIHQNGFWFGHTLLGSMVNFGNMVKIMTIIIIIFLSDFSYQHWWVFFTSGSLLVSSGLSSRFWEYCGLDSSSSSSNHRTSSLGY